MSGSFAEETGIKPYRYERPPFGVFGQVATVGDRLVCHICGRDFRGLGQHIARAHAWTAAAYREAFDLAATMPLVTADIREYRRIVGRRAPKSAAFLASQGGRLGLPPHPTRRRLSDRLARTGAGDGHPRDSRGRWAARPAKAWLS